MPMLRRKQIPNRLNVRKKRISISPKIQNVIGRGSLLLLSVSILAFFAVSGWGAISKAINESYRPGLAKFSACSPLFLQVKTKPLYGVILRTEGSFVKDIFLTSPTTTGSVKAIRLTSSDWVPVYFSKNFTFTQIGEILRLSRLETGDYDPCYVIEQLSLTSGVPVEYILIDDSEKGLQTTVTIAEAQELLRGIEQNTPLQLRTNLLGLRKLDDGTEVSVITYEAFREQYPDFFKIDEIAQEQAFVEVYNATDISGYASIVSRKWAMLGIDISRIGNATYEEVGDALAVMYVRDSLAYSRTQAIIKSSFPNGKLVVKEGRPSNLVTTGDIVVFLIKR